MRRWSSGRRSLAIVAALVSAVSCRLPQVPEEGPAPLPSAPPAAPLPRADAPPYRPSAPTRIVLPAQSEPTAGQWRPVLFPSADAAAPAAPPDEAGTRAEMARLHDLAFQRGGDVGRHVNFWDAGGVRRWNEIARGMAVKYGLSSSHACRIMALLAVAQYDALVATWHAKYRYKRPAPAAREGWDPMPVRHAEEYSYPSEHAAVAAASAEVLTFLLPREALFLKRNAMAHGGSRLLAGTNYPSDNDAGYAVGVKAAEKAIEWAKADGAADAGKGAVPKQEGKWWFGHQILPGWGKVKPWLMKSGDALRAPAPPPPGTPGFQAAVAEIRAFSDTLTAEQLAVAQHWNLGVGGISVPGMWDQLALDWVEGRSFSEPRTARMLALMNMAMMDASIASWDSKYHYLVPRPSHADPQIGVPLGLPAHPSYTSGHSALSGAAAVVIGYVLPDRAAEATAMAEEASASRWYGGIHYRFDGDEGLRQGEGAAALAVERGKTDGCPPR